MGVAYDAASESHTGTTGSASETSFGWTHTPVGTPKGVVVFVFEDAVVREALSTVTSVVYGGQTMEATDALAVDASGEPGFVRAYFLGDSVPTGAQTVTVNRTNTAAIMYAIAFSVTASGNTWVPPTWVRIEGDGTNAEQSIDDLSLSGGNSQRFGFQWTGVADPTTLTAGANSTLGPYIDLGTNGVTSCYETTPGTGARSVGFGAGASDDRAGVFLAVSELPTSDVIRHGVSSCSHSGSNESTSEASFSWTHKARAPKGAYVAVITRSSSAAPDTGVTYGGSAMSLVSALTAVDAGGEPSTVHIYQLGSSVPTGHATVTVSRTNNGVPQFAYCWTVNGTRDTEADTSASVLLQDDGALAEQSVGMTSGRGSGQRYVVGYHGHSAGNPVPGANSRNLVTHNYSLSGSQLLTELTGPGTGSRSVGLVEVNSDDRAFPHFAVQYSTDTPAGGGARSFVAAVVG